MLTAKPRFPIREMVLYGWMPSFLKTLVYRLKGYRVGGRASFAFGSVICGKRVRIGSDFSQGFFSMIRGEEIELGHRVKVGALSMLDTPVLAIGDDSKINEQVFAGGLQFPHSSLKIGRNSQVQQLSFINPAPSVTIGDDTSIGGHCLIFGHQSWLSVFEGYSADFRPIVIGSNVGIAWRVFVGAGAKIGDGAMIGTHSVVNRTIPPRCLATGSPAKVVGEAPYFPRQLNQADREEIYRDISVEMVAFLRGHGMDCQQAGDVIEIRRTAGRWPFRRIVCERIWMRTASCSEDLAFTFPTDAKAYVSLTAIPQTLRDRLAATGILWMDIEKRERADFGNDAGEEVIQFLRRYGVRFYREGSSPSGSVEAGR
jgi:acetyltransferase-like isoleucine patch superfamily enzyme